MIGQKKPTPKKKLAASKKITSDINRFPTNIANNHKTSHWERRESDNTDHKYKNPDWT